MAKAPDDNIIVNPGLNLIGTSGNDALVGGATNDTLEGKGGADILDGAGGSDTASYASSAAAVTVNLATNVNTGGDAQGDLLYNIENLRGSNYNDHLTGDANNNILTGGLGSDVLDGGAGVDTANYSTSSTGVTVNLTTHWGTGGDAQGDYLTNIENITGSAYYDTLTGDSGSNSLNGGAGNDVLEGKDGADTLNGGGDVDTATYASSASGVIVNLTTNVNTGGDAQGDLLYAIENLTGSNYNDTLTGNSSSNVISGGYGDDTLDGKGGADALDGGAGTDTVTYAASTSAVSVDMTTNANSGGDAQGDTLTNIENIIGSAYADTLTGSAYNNVITAGNGNDVLEGRGGADTIDGGNGTDTASYANSSGQVTVNLTTNVNTYWDAQGDVLTNIENVTGSAFNDTLTGNSSINVLFGGAGNDTLEGRGGADTLDGSIGTDTATYANSTTAVTVNLTTGVNTGGDALNDILISIENLTGTAYNDTLTGDTSTNALSGGNGDDVLEGRGGADTIDGGTGVDTASYANSSAAVTVNMLTNVHSGGDAQGDSLLNIENVTGSSHDDFLTGNANANTLTGGAGSDTLEGRGGADTLNGSAGIDYASYAASTAVNINLGLTTGQVSGGDASGDILQNIEGVIGSNYADTLTGNTSDNFFEGKLGADVINGLGGSDTAIYVHSASAVSLNLGTATYTGGDAQGDTLTSIENLIGSAFNDTLIGDSNNNTLEGGAGADMINGGTGTDTVSYASSNAGVTVNLSLTTAQISAGHASGDSLINIDDVLGSSYDDILSGGHALYGGNGSDTLSQSSLMTGGNGADNFVIDCGAVSGTTNITVTDFVQGTDHVTLQNGVSYSQLTISYVNNGTQIDFGNDHMFVQNVNLISSDFN